MLCKVIIPFKSERKLKYGYITSSVMHGILMGTISSTHADNLHQQSLRPFSQFSYYDNGENFWCISVLGEENYEKIIPPVLALDSVAVKQKKDVIFFGKPQLSIRTYEQLLNDNMVSGGRSDVMRLDFITPTAFKTAGKYNILPTSRLIFLSLAKRFDFFCGIDNNDYDFLSQEIEKNISVSDYSLSSSSFSLEGIRIPSFIGHIIFRISGDEKFRSYISLLCDFAEYSGIGIKTALGMGHIITEYNPKKATLHR